MIFRLESIICRAPVLLQAGSGIDIAAGANQGNGWDVFFNIFIGFVVLVVIVLVGYFVARVYRAKSGTPSLKKSEPTDALARSTRARVNKALDRGEYEVAGDLLAHAGIHQKAAEAYADAGAFAKAARSFQLRGDFQKAIHFYKRAGDFEMTAHLYAESGEHRASAAEYLQAKNYGAAAAQYELSDDPHRAAENFERVAQFRKAAQNYEKSDHPLKAAECYAAFFDRQSTEQSGGDLPSEQSAAQAAVLQAPGGRKAARRAGELWQQADKPELAAEIFYRAGYLEEAAECMRLAGDFGRAAEWLLQAGQPLKAAEVLEEGGASERAARMRAEAALRGGDSKSGAEMLAEAGELGRAAAIFVELDEFERAATLFEQIGDHKRAADLYEALEQHGLEARCAELGGQISRAADAYRRAGDVESEIRLRIEQGDFFRAGRLLFEHRRFVEALDVLAKIDSANPIYLRALELAGDIYQSQGRYERAFSRYKSALGQREITASTLPLLYKMARSLEEEKDFSGAMVQYNSIVDVDPHFEDASARLKGIRKRLRRGSLAGTRTSGIFTNVPEGDDVVPSRYEVIDEVARGGMGIVYKARDTVLGRVVAFKILGENLKDNQVAVKYFLREARAAAALSHSNIVTIYDAGEQDGEYYMAMEFVEGTTLKQLIQRKGALGENQVRYVLDYCCQALEYAHSKGVVHRDIKSGNVMLTVDKALKIMDFGLAKFLREYQNNHTQQVGTPFYMSPEQIIGKDLDFRSDLYSLGCTVFECATGKVPFYKGDLSYHHLHTDPPRPRSLNPALSPEIEEIILKLLVKNPDQRYQSAGNVLGALKKI